MNPLIGQLQAAVGHAHVLLPGAADLQAYEQDWRGRERGHALAVVRPGSTAEVAAVVRACADALSSGQQVSIVPQGGNTGLVLGGTPDASGTQVVLSLNRMNAVRSLDVPNATITVEAGCVLQVVQQRADAANLLFPLSLAAQGSCQIGGNLATNAGGTQVLRYGNARDLCLGLEVVLANGEVTHGLSGLRKDNTGYNLNQLFVGSEGTLGIITAATLKLFPKPHASLTAWACVDSVASAIALLSLAQRQLASGLTGFELMGNQALRLVAEHMPQLRLPLWPGSTQSAPYSVLLELADFEGEAHARSRLEAVFEQAFAQDLVLDAVLAESVAQSLTLWHVRDGIPLAQAQAGLNIKHDISVPVSAIAAFCEATDALLASRVPGARLVNFGHLGDGNLHYNLQCPAGEDAAVFLARNEAAVNALVYEQVLRFGGSISAEHGIGRFKRQHLAHTKDPASLSAMRAIKAALDPLGLLNPGVML